METVIEHSYINQDAKTITVPSSVKLIESNASIGCPQLKKVVIPNRVNLGNNSFDADCQIIRR